MILIDGKKVASEIKGTIRDEVTDRVGKGGKRPHLAAILVGNDGGSESYVANKVRDCEEVGFQSTLIRMEPSVTEAELLASVFELNRNPSVDGFIVQLPLPVQIREHVVIESIDPLKDVDGFHPVTIGKMTLGLPSFLPATPAGILKLLEYYEIQTSGKHCVVIGRSNIVGTPLSILLSRKANPGNCTVTLCHSYTQNMGEICRQADIIVAALGKPGFLKGEMVKEDAVVIDVGTTRIPSDTSKSGWKLCGDVAFNEVAPKCSYITPVPGGVGPMTRVGLLLNTLKAASVKNP
ncbi:MAG TPA: bifunctional 5,10-methylene-tetrahydrofolate dehydrogenase/5,10-methylene-tetrahydrofolate cyclohydrolase [Bacteroidales bacterium]|nr:bifunctional 5,10-methylene-tetrahydrofolate dehydrogenase/5,10-methylene-tetrahydrofolate cyclohydrolase [Bacteroidales bacterium]